jgi:hypothetical protein
MINVELFVDQVAGTRVAQFARIARFILADQPENNAELAQLFADQCNRFGWPVTFPDPQETERGTEYPVIAFIQNARDGTVEYGIIGWEPTYMPEPKGMADNPEVISPASGAKGEGKTGTATA